MMTPTKQIIRGSVAIRQGDSWRGVFKYSESNPHDLGPELWETLQEHWKDLHRFANMVLQYGYWEEYLNDGLCVYCGKYDKGHPHKINGQLLVACQNGKIAFNYYRAGVRRPTRTPAQIILAAAPQNKKGVPQFSRSTPHRVARNESLRAPSVGPRRCATCMRAPKKG